jgi:hypothetical protein
MGKNVLLLDFIEADGGMIEAGTARKEVRQEKEIIYW